MRRSFRFTFLLPFLFVGPMACGDDTVAPERSLDRITVSGIPASLAAGRTAQLTATGTYSDGEAEDLTGTVTWSSHDTAVAAISAAGQLTAVAEGSTQVTASFQAVAGSGSVMVTAPELDSIALAYDGEALRVTDQREPTVTAHYSDDTDVALDPAGLTWSVTGDTGVVTVSGNGVATGEAVGSTAVRAEHPDGLTAEVAVTVRAFANEGSSSEPLTPDLPYRGEVGDGNSYYRIAGLTPGEPHTIRVTAIRDSVYVHAWADRFSNRRCWSIRGTDDVPCALNASASGEVYLSVTAVSPAGSIYTVDVEPGGLVAEGAQGEPLDITGLLAYTGTVNISDSWYVVTGLTPEASYTVELTNPTDDVTLMADSAWAVGGTSNNPCRSTEPGLADESCAAPASAAGELQIRVYGGHTAEGAAFTLDVTGGGLVNEGTTSDPGDITGVLPYAGQVSTGWSYYVVTGFTAGETYTVSLADVTDDVALRVHSDSTFYYTSFECRSDVYGINEPESCAALAVSGSLFVAVGGFDTDAGATFTVDVAPGGIPKEGYYSDPLDLTGALPHDGSVNGDVSYYVVTGLAPGSDVTVTLTNLTDNAELWVYDNGEYTGTYCTSFELGTADESCTLAASASGEIHIRVTTASTLAGIYYTVDIQ